MNNFDKSSTGVNIELRVCRLDYNDDFDHTMTRLADEKWGCNAAFFFNNYDSTTPPTIADISNKRHVKSELGINASDALDDWAKLDDCINAGAVFKGFEKYECCTGQGYYVTVFFKRPAKFTAEWETATRQNIDNILTSTRFVCVLNVDGDDFFVDEFVDDAYEYDSDEILKIVKTELSIDAQKLDAVVAFCTKNLPEVLPW